MIYDFLIIGAGFAGSVCARELANKGYKIKLIDSRNHVGGNAYDKYDDHGILIHPYGPHIFHTNSKKIFDYLSQFTEWNFYEHVVLANINNRLYPFPINIKTINMVFNTNLKSPDEVEVFLKSQRVSYRKIDNSEKMVLSRVGPKLCNMFFKGYTKKQWNLDLSELAASVAARIPVRSNFDKRYFTDKYQAMPKHGYTNLFKKMLNHSNISIELCCDYFDNKNRFKADKVIYTGPIDKFYDYKFGPLPYRSLKFKHEHYIKNSYQEAATVNYPLNFKFTRITEFKKITQQNAKGTSIVKEYPTSNGDPYYPIPNKTNEKLNKKYEKLSKNTKNVFFIGRLAQYRYYNMDQVVASALVLVKKIESRKK